MKVGNKMKFELNDYHRNISDEDLIKDVVITAQKLKKRSLTVEEYKMCGKFNPSTLQRRFGTWKRVLELSSLEIDGHSFKFEYSDEEVKSDIINVTQKLGLTTITAKEYEIYGKFSSSTLIKKYGGWNKILKMSNLELNLNRSFSKQDLLEEIERMWIELGRQPTTTDIKNGISKYSLQSYSRRFGGWRGALEAFVEWINDESDDSGEPEKEIKLFTGAQHTFVEKASHSTNRDINYRLRFKVMQRDNFKCCMCGASPAKDPSVVLHIDHIIPWSKGGETTMENLQTLCSKCNLGKSDLMPE